MPVSFREINLREINSHVVNAFRINLSHDQLWRNQSEWDQWASIGIQVNGLPVSGFVEFLWLSTPIRGCIGTTDRHLELLPLPRSFSRLWRRYSKDCLVWQCNWWHSDYRTQGWITPGSSQESAGPTTRVQITVKEREMFVHARNTSDTVLIKMAFRLLQQRLKPLLRLQSQGIYMNSDPSLVLWTIMQSSLDISLHWFSHWTTYSAGMYPGNGIRIVRKHLMWYGVRGADRRADKNKAGRTGKTEQGCHAAGISVRRWSVLCEIVGIANV